MVGSNHMISCLNTKISFTEYRSVQELRQECLGLGGRFIRQFGIIAHPNVMTIESGFLNPTHSLSESQSPKDYHLQSEISRQTKTRSVEKETTPYIFENFQPRTGSVAEIVYLTQLAQSESLYIAYSICRLKWHTPQHRDCGGALLWHMNDLWPTTSCSIVDCYKRPKMAFYSTARALKPISLITSRVTEDMPKRNIQMEEAVGGHEISEKDVPAAANQSVPGSIFRKTTIQVVLSSILPKTTDDLHIEVRYVCMSTGESEVVYTAPAVSIEGNRSIEIYGAEVPAESSTVVHSVLQKSSPSGVVLARDTSWPRLIKRVGMVSSESGLNVEVSPRDVESDEAEIKITAEKPIKGLLFEERDGEIWTDNAVDVVPGDLYKILVRGINSKDKWNPKSWKSYGSC
jgi:beta-mannosidase